MDANTNQNLQTVYDERSRTPELTNNPSYNNAPIARLHVATTDQSTNNFNFCLLQEEPEGGSFHIVF